MHPAQCYFFRVGTVFLGEKLFVWKIRCHTRTLAATVVGGSSYWLVGGAANWIDPDVKIFIFIAN